MNVQRLKQSCQAQKSPDLKDGVIIELIEMIEAAEAKLAELEKQPPVGEAVNIGGAIMVEWERCISDGTQLFTRPAPAINLGELVKKFMPSGADNNIEQFYGCSDDFCAGWNHHAAEFLRNIEEAK